MTSNDNEEEIKRLPKSAYQPAAPSLELREQLLKRLTRESCAVSTSVYQPAWQRLRVWMPIAISLTAAAVAYGVWLSLTY